MSWSYLALIPLLLCGLSCLPLGRVRRAALGALTWVGRLSALSSLALLGILLLEPQWLPAEVALSLEAWLALPPPEIDGVERVFVLLLFAGAITLVTAPLLAFLDFTRSLSRHESNCHTLTQLLRDTLQLVEHTRPIPTTAETPRPSIPPLPTPRPSANRLRPLSELLG